MMIVTAILFSLAMAAVALWSNARLRGEARLPMQWGFNRQVTWSAPRPIALAFIPVLACSMFAAVVALSLNVPPRPGQEAMVLPTFIGIGVTFVAVQLLHLWLIGRALRRGDG